MPSHSPLCEAIRLQNDIDYLLKKPEVQKRASFLCPKCRNPPLKVAVITNQPRSIIHLLSHISPDKYLWHVNVISLEIVRSPPADIAGFVDMLAVMRLKVGAEKLKEILNTETTDNYPALVYVSWLQIAQTDIASQIAACFVAQVLLKNGADVHGYSDTKMTCLHMACLGNSPALVDLYLEYKADVNALSAEGLTPLDAALSGVSFTGRVNSFTREKIAPLVRASGGLLGSELRPPSPQPAQQPKKKRPAEPTKMTDSPKKKKRTPRQKLADPPKKTKKDVRKMFCPKCGYLRSFPWKTCVRCT